MSDTKGLAKDYFERHPLSNECHITTDGRVFHSAGAAQGYATALKENAVEKFTRDQKQVDAEGQPTIFDYNETTTYEDAKKLVKALGLKPASQKKEDVFAALDAEKATAQTAEVETEGDTKPTE